VQWKAREGGSVAGEGRHGYSGEEWPWRESESERGKGVCDDPHLHVDLWLRFEGGRETAEHRRGRARRTEEARGSERGERGEAGGEVGLRAPFIGSMGGGKGAQQVEKRAELVARCQWPSRRMVVATVCRGAEWKRGDTI